MEQFQQIRRAKVLRKNQTDAERKLWSKLRDNQIDGVKFRRQQPIGNYIADFVSFEKRLIIEIDGGQHNEDKNTMKDEQRTAWLEKDGYRVIRFWNNDVLLNSEGVLMKIREATEIE
jgi:very-short-patch-repair endonuclease